MPDAPKPGLICKGCGLRAPMRGRTICQQCREAKRDSRASLPLFNPAFKEGRFRKIKRRKNAARRRKDAT